MAEEYRSLRLWDEAIQVLQQGLKQHPTYYIGRALLAQVYFEKGEYVRASIEAEEVLAHSPLHLSMFKIVTLSFYKLQDFEKSSLYLRKWLTLFPENVAALQIKKEMIQNKSKSSIGDYVMAPLQDIFRHSSRLALGMTNTKQKKVEFLTSLLLKLQKRHEKNF